MPTRPSSSVWHPHTVALLAFTAAVYAVALAVVRTPAFAGHPDLIGRGVAADLVLVVPLAYWALVVRRGAATLRSLLPAVALSVLGAKVVLPSEHRSFVGLVRYVTVPFEVALLGYGIWGARRALRSAGTRRDATGFDVAEVLEHGFVAVLGDRAAAHVLAAEIATLHYALFARRSDGDTWGNAAVFWQEGARSAAMTWGFALAIAVETAGMHLLLVRAHPVAAWGLAALGVYSVLWLVGHHRATGLRPVVLAGDTLTVRAGFRLTARVPRAAVTSAEEISWRTAPRPAPDYFNAARPGTPNVMLTLGQPTAVTGPLGLRRTVTRIGLRLDDPAGFVAALA